MASRTQRSFGCRDSLRAELMAVREGLYFFMGNGFLPDSI